MNRRRTLAALGSVTLAACTPPLRRGTAPPPAAPPPSTTTPAQRAAAARLEGRFAQLAVEAGLPGLAVALLHDDDVLLTRGYGESDLERHIAATEKTPFDIASVAKPISAVVAMQLVERGQLDLDRPMTAYRGFSEFCREAHAEGGPFFGDLACESHALTLRQVLSMSANGTPGSRFLYNPVLYSWASRPMMQATTVPFSTLVEQFVLLPAGMSRSARFHRGKTLAGDFTQELAVPYHRDAEGRFVRSPRPPQQGDGAAGGVISNAMDLARFDRALMQGQLIRMSSVEAMWTPGLGADGRPRPYGLGWFVKRRGSQRVVWHTGLWEGAYSALYLKLPELGLTLILLANSGGLAWPQQLDEAAIERSPFAMAFFEAFGV